MSREVFLHNYDFYNCSEKKLSQKNPGMCALSPQKTLAFYLTTKSEYLVPVGEETGQHFMPSFVLNIEAVVKLKSV